MKLSRFIFHVACCSGLAVAMTSVAASAQDSATPRLQGLVDEARRVVLPGNAPPREAEDMGAVEDSFPAGRILLLLRRSSQQEAALQEFIQAAHSPGNPAYRQWLTPGEFGRLYGPADSDLAAVTAWLQGHGLTVNKVHEGRVAIEFTATAGQLRAAFHTEVHSYLVGGETRLAYSAAPSVPAALAPLITGIASTNGYHPRPQLKVMGQATFNPQTHQSTPNWTYPAGSGVSYVVAPGDFTVQYDLASVYKANLTGVGQSIGIVSASNVDLSLVQAYRSLFKLAANQPQVVVDGADPGQNSASTEAYLDLEVAGSVAPGATIILYTSGGTALSEGLALAALRAVEDDVAGILSVSYGECELQLGQSGNTFWNALWQQAAAQGQSVFVSAGDAGSAGCDDFDSQLVAYSGLQVNGLASTPYNIAVGGTDFYYSQAAGTSTQINTQLATYWSGSSTAPTVSLKQTVPEQAWNDYFGLNLTDGEKPANLATQTILAGGGGASSAALYTSGKGAGYAKPAWQSGTGVPADKVRDLPDLSLFAANGSNYSFYPICASPGDCTNTTASGAVVITGVGGTSASAPAMAAIQALVNQNAKSWAGQANYVYYPLAKAHPTVFHDVTVGGNQVLCYQGTANCAAGSSGTSSSGYQVEKGYATTAGYDLATGLGSVDVANLIKYWSSVVPTPTTTTLSVSPVSLIHGKTTTVTGSVAPSKGTGTPTGTITLTGNDGLTHYASIDGFTLATGKLNAIIDNLPGGSYQLTAVYGGDGTFGASKSQPVSVTVTQENDTVATAAWAWNPYDLNYYQLTSGITIPYGAQVFLDAQPISSNATITTQATPATGTVTFTDKLGTATNAATRALDAVGVAEWSTGVFAPGSHSVSTTYSGDASYFGSMAATATTFIVIPGSTSLTVKPLVSTVAAGASVTVDVQLATGYRALWGTLPTGNVTVTLGGKSATAAWQAFGPTGSANLEAEVTFTNLAAGILPLTASYPGDANWLGSGANGGTILAIASKPTPTVSLASNLASPALSQSFTLTATVAGPSGKATPTGKVVFLSDDQSFSATATLTNGKATLVVAASSMANGSNLFTAVYQGDTNYTAAASGAVSVTVAQSDYSLTTLNATLTIPRGKSAVSTLVLTPLNSFSGIVTITVSTPSGITASLAATAPKPTAPLTDALTINAASSTAVGIYSITVSSSGGGHVHTAQILVRVS
jgi:hypothetical protein